MALVGADFKESRKERCQFWSSSSKHNRKNAIGSSGYSFILSYREKKLLFNLACKIKYVVKV